MGFCRRCGDIVIGARCKCGGTAVAPVVQWRSGAVEDDKQDQWSRTYTRERSPARTTIVPPTPAPVPALAPTSASAGNVGRFPRPRSHSSSQSRPINPRVSAHIEATTSVRPPVSARTSLYANQSASLSANDILRDPETMELSKVYGSVLQPKETLASFCCNICSSTFPPDATIYPDPSTSSASAGRYLCKTCFVKNGGSKGDCYSCQRPVLILKREGGFIETANRVYHKVCFNCEGCGKNIGNHPMVDLMGRPSCPDCFDSSLSRADAPRGTVRTPTKNRNIGGMHSSRSREGSPTLDELEERLGIPRRRADSAVSTSASDRGLAEMISERPRRLSVSTRSTTVGAEASSARPSQPNPAKLTEDAVEEMKRRFLKTPTGSPFTTPTKNTNTTPNASITSPKYSVPELKTRRSLVSLRATSTEPTSPPSLSNNHDYILAPTPERIISTRNFSSERGGLNGMTATLRGSASIPSTPDLISDASDTATQSSGLTTPPRITPLRFPSSYGVTPIPSLRDHASAAKQTNARLVGSPETRKIFHSKRSLENLRIPAPLSPESKCARCSIPLFTTNGGKFVTVPEEPTATGAAPKVYHSDCFTCRVCDGVFPAGEQGRAVFVRTQDGPCHVDCAPVEKIKARPISTHYSFPTPTSPPQARSSTSSSYSSHETPPPPLTAPMSNGGNFPALNMPGRCPGCFKSVSPMERGVVPGPQGTRWHSSCLVCGGQEAKGRNGRREGEHPGCGKKLDSAAKVGPEGGVWCRECSLLLSASPTRGPLLSQGTGMGGSFWSTRNDAAAPRVPRQFTGVTTIAKQQTGLGHIASSSDPDVLRQLTGGGLSPTRQLGATGLAKQFTGSGVRSNFTGSGMTRSYTTALNTTPTGNRIPRPKSAGSRTKSIDESGRGMALMRQLTGGTGSFQSHEV